MGIYTVQKGDTLGALAAKFNTTIDKLMELNTDIKNPNSIFIGQTIKFEQESAEEWVDNDGDGKVSFGDFQGCGKYSLFINQVMQYIGKTWNDSIAKNIQNLYNQFVANPNEAALSGIQINGLGIKYDGKSNFYRNSLDRDLSDITLKDNKESSTITVVVNFGSEIDARDRKVSDFLKKVLGDNLDNTTKISEENGKYKTFSTRLENTDLYKSFISSDVNPDMFTQEQFGKYKDDVFKPEFSGSVQLPSLEKTQNGVKYFTLHKRDGSVIYFDETGKKIDDLNSIKAQVPEQKTPQTPVAEPVELVETPEEFKSRDGYRDDKLNVGAVYLDGKEIEKSLNSNYYANQLDNMVNSQTLNSKATNSIMLQLKAGENLKNKWDLSAKDILKKFLGDNLNNTTYIENGELQGKKLEETDLYKKFMAVNPQLLDFKAGDEIAIQLPVMKIDSNGTRFFTLIGADNNPMYFDEKGELI